MSSPITAPTARHRASTASRAGAGSVALLLLVPLLPGKLPGRPSAQADLSPPDARLRLDPNTATRDELMLLPEIGPALSERIVAYRESVAARPAFAMVGDLDNVHGIGPRTIAGLRPHLRFERDPSDQGLQEP